MSTESNTVPTAPMLAIESLLGALQLSDSALPIGRFVHSLGVESWLAENPEADAEELVELTTVVLDSTARLDGVFLAHAVRATDLAELQALDQGLTARKTIPAARQVSTGCGRQLAALAPKLCTSGLVAQYADAVRMGLCEGNQAVVAGALCSGLGVDPTTAVAVELRSTAAAAFSVAIRLGRLSPTLAQELLAGLRPRLARATEIAVLTDLDQAFSSAPELEIAALAHRRREIRFFST